MKLSSSLIYDAAFDDELFNQLPGLLAKAMQARSCVLHWRDPQGSAEIFAHSGYFSDDNMADYAANFASHDLWTDAGMKQGRVNRAWRVSDLVSSREYEGSVFYNEWIRGMGDDTHYCSGSVMRTNYGDGIIGLHRGRTQQDFSEDSLRELNGHVEHLRRMFQIRARVIGISERSKLLEAMLGSSGLATFVLSQGGQLLLASASGETALHSGRLLRRNSGRLEAASPLDNEALNRALFVAAQRTEPLGSTFVIGGLDGQSIIASATPINSGVHSAAQVLLTLQTRTLSLETDLLKSELRKRFTLTGAESEVAIGLADGKSVTELSDERKCSIATLRVQVKIILSKLGARRQSDIVRSVERIRHGQS